MGSKNSYVAVNVHCVCIYRTVLISTHNIYFVSMAVCTGYSGCGERRNAFENLH